MEVLVSILKMSLIGSIIFSIYLLIRPLTRKYFNSSWHYYLLIMILTFYIIPVGSFIKFPAKTRPSFTKLLEEEKAINSNKIGEDIARRNIENPKDTVNFEDTIKDQPKNTFKEEEPTQKESDNYSQDINKVTSKLPTDLILYIWIGGIILLFLLRNLAYIRFKSIILKNSIEMKDKNILDLFNVCREELNIKRPIPLKICRSISSPMLIGIFKPIILVPSIDEDPKTLEMIFTHELNHYKRKDIIIKYFSLLVNLIHWFNPIIYILLRKIDIYCEYSIDEKVVDKMELEDRKHYGEIILELADQSIKRSKSFTTAMGSEEKALKSRLENILFSKRSSKSSYIVSLLALILLFISGLTVACNIMPGSEKVNNSFVVYIKDDGLYYSDLRGEEEIKIHEGGNFEYPLISKAGDYIAYTKKGSLYIYHIEDHKYEKIADEINHYYISYDWVDKKTIVYSY